MMFDEALAVVMKRLDDLSNRIHELNARLTAIERDVERREDYEAEQREYDD